jgi:bifunctional non-homologous end joining protein LigD
MIGPGASRRSSRPRLKLRKKHFVIDGEVPADEGEDYSRQALLRRKANLARLLSRPVDGIFIAEYEQGDNGDVLFRVACNLGLEGIVSKRLDRAYDAGKCKYKASNWVKLNNPAHPA